MVSKRMKTNPNIARRPWQREPGEEAACLRLETPESEMGIAARAAGKPEVSVSSVVGDAREMVSQPATSVGEDGKHLLGISLGSVDLKMIPGVVSEAPEIISAPVLQEQALSTGLPRLPRPSAR